MLQGKGASSSNGRFPHLAPLAGQHGKREGSADLPDRTIATKKSFGVPYQLAICSDLQKLATPRAHPARVEKILSAKESTNLDIGTESPLTP